MLNESKMGGKAISSTHHSLFYLNGNWYYPSRCMYLSLTFPYIKRIKNLRIAVDSIRSVAITTEETLRVHKKNELIFEKNVFACRFSKSPFGNYLFGHSSSKRNQRYGSVAPSPSGSLIYSGASDSSFRFGRHPAKG
jgi:hypothetical protein